MVGELVGEADFLAGIKGRGSKRNMKEFFKSNGEFRDVLGIVRFHRQNPETLEIMITGSAATHGKVHNDVDILVIKDGDEAPYLEHVKGKGRHGENLHVFIANDMADGLLYESLRKKGRVVFKRKG